ncbi:MAG: hypothetical protein BWY97_00060 [Tenericutes bacterium ADurb.BinA124]|nr:MAG: hypothetical protein BWY97_00060 [Tenericutes bacterium ADurb.BinA124]
MKISDFWQKDNELMKRLKEADLPIPYKVIQKIKVIGPPKRGERKDRFVTFYELFEGKFLERTVAFRFDKRIKELPFKYMEVSRKLEGQSNKILRNVDFTYMGLPYVNWFYEPKKTKTCWWYFESKRDDIWYLWSSHNYNLHDNTFQSFADLVELDPSIKYCGYDYLREGFDEFIKYVTIFRKLPEVEMYAKKRIYHLITDSRFYKKMKKSKEFVKYVKDNLEEIQVQKYNYPTILKAFKAKTTIRRFYNRERILKSNNFKGNETILTPEKIDKILDLYSDVEMYLDYFNAAKHFIYMDNNKALYPSNLKEAHDHYVNLYSAKKKDIETAAFLQVVSKWGWLNWKSKGICIIIAPNPESLVIEGQSLGHCVGKMGYGERMAQGKNLILFIRKAEEQDIPYYTMEFDKEKREVIQCRGEHQALPTEEIKVFIGRWIKKISQLESRVILSKG